MVAGFALGVMSSYVIFVMSTSVLTDTNEDIGSEATLVSCYRSLSNEQQVPVQTLLGLASLEHLHSLLCI